VRYGHVDIVRYLITEHDVDLINPCVAFNGKPLQLAYQQWGRHHPVTHLLENALKEKGLYNENDYYVRPESVENEQVINKENKISDEDENFEQGEEDFHEEEENQFEDQEYVTDSELSEL
jgi:hypothetical protein